MNKELEKLHEWLCINRLSLNIIKTNSVIFHSFNKPKAPMIILINKEAIDEVKHVKYLGKLIGILYKLRPLSLPKFFFMYIMPLPTHSYCMELRSGEILTLLDSIHILQKKLFV